jgi:hypothetical protein
LLPCRRLARLSPQVGPAATRAMQRPSPDRWRQQANKPYRIRRRGAWAGLVRDDGTDVRRTVTNRRGGEKTAVALYSDMLPSLEPPTVMLIAHR